MGENPMSDEIPKYLTLQELSHHLCLGEGVILEMVEDGELPAPEKRSGKVVWCWQDVEGAMVNGAANTRCVYFIEMQDFIKIGFTTNIRRRLYQIKRGLPYQVKLLHQMPGDFDLELDIHRRWNHLRYDGEWFHKSPDLLDFIERLRTSDEPISPNFARVQV